MKLFGRKEENKPCCGGNCDQENMSKAESLKLESGIKILGSGCTKCNLLEKATKEAIDELGLKLEIDHVRDFAQIASYGVMSTPALVFNGKVVSYGKVLSSEEVKVILNKYYTSIEG